MQDRMAVRFDIMIKGRNKKYYQYNIGTYILNETKLLPVPKNVIGENGEIILSNFIISLESLAKRLRTTTGYKYKRKSK